MALAVPQAQLAERGRLAGAIAVHSWFRRLPLTARLPLMVAGMIFVAAVVTTQVVIYSLSMQFETQMDRLSQVYLDGLSAALLPPVKVDDRAEVKQVLDQAFEMQIGVVDRRLLFLDPTGIIIAQSDRPGLSPFAALPAGVGHGSRGIHFDRTDRSMWAWRELVTPGIEQTEQVWGTAVANLDLAKFIGERTRLQWSLTSIDVFFSSLCALFGFTLARQLQRPVVLLAEHLEKVAENGPQPVPAGMIPTDDRETAKLIQAFNQMANGARERETMLGKMAEQEREAILGRMAATLAHEVRNPLGGVLAALNTLRKFGEDKGTREESIDFMERGLLTIQEVADATLKTHRPNQRSRSLSRADLLDVQRLVEGEARRRGVTVEVDSQLSDTVLVSATEVRQVLLNLLLNATRATTPGGNVRLRGRVVGNELMLEVIDQGSGLAPELARGLEQGDLPSGHNGLGVDVIVRLMERLQGRVSVKAHSGGTHVSLYLPISEGPGI